MKISRRAFILGGATATISTVAAINAFPLIDTTEALELVSVELPCPRLPREFSGYKIGFISDLHFGPNMSDEFIAHALLTLKTAAVDIIILGGDYIWFPESLTHHLFKKIRSPRYLDHSAHDVNEIAFRELIKITALLNPPDGIFAVAGNHDRWTDNDAMNDAFARSNVHLLENSYVNIKRLNSQISLLGVADYLTATPEIPADFDSEKNFAVLVSHNPDFISELLRDKSPLPFDLALSGHTHGGQIALPYIGPPITRVSDTRFLQGLVPLSGRFADVTRGVGVVEIPYRVGVRPEVTVLTLKTVIM